jgi:hypothetical protein
MALIKARSRGINLADTFAFSGTVTGAGGGKVLQTSTANTTSTAVSSATSYSAFGNGMDLTLTPSSSS